MDSLTPSFREVLERFHEHGVRFLVVGSYAVAALVHPRYVKDLDLFIERSPDNARRVLAALEAFGFRDLGLTETDFLTEIAVELGYEPTLIDVISSLRPPTSATVSSVRSLGFPFAEAYAHRITVTIDGTVIPFAHPDAVFGIKRQIMRVQDVADLAILERGDPEGRTIEQRIRETERLRRARIADSGDPDRPIAHAVRRKPLRSKEVE